MAIFSSKHLAAALCEFLYSSHFYFILWNFALKTMRRSANKYALENKLRTNPVVILCGQSGLLDLDLIFGSSLYFCWH